MKQQRALMYSSAHPRPGRMKTTDKQMIVVDSAQQNPFHAKANFL
jgi:hypothetical protein